MKFYGISWKSIILSALMGIGVNLMAKNAAYNMVDYDLEAAKKKALADTNGKETENPKG